MFRSVKKTVIYLLLSNHYQYQALTSELVKHIEDVFGMFESRSKRYENKTNFFHEMNHIYTEVVREI